MVAPTMAQHRNTSSLTTTKPKTKQEAKRSINHQEEYYEEDLESN
jgi:hypothetical protein